MISTGNTNNEASGGIWQNSRNNPTFPAKCGINVALVLDLSNSVTDAQLVQLKAAANGFVDALTGTPSAGRHLHVRHQRPSRQRRHHAATDAGLHLGRRDGGQRTGSTADIEPGGNGGGTNWDRGIYQVAQSTSTFDVAVVITDGNPTFYGSR